jgi:uncharacterized protein (DUF302 family)
MTEAGHCHRGLAYKKQAILGPRRLVVKCWLFAALVMGLVVKGSATGTEPASFGEHSSPREARVTTVALGKKGTGIVRIPSNHTVDETVDKLKTILQSKGVTLFALIDHSGEAAKVGMRMPPTKLVIFGNPRGCTSLMLAAPSVAIDLPLKILVAEDSHGKVWVSYNSSQYLQQRYGLPGDLLPSIAVVQTLAARAAE